MSPTKEKQLNGQDKEGMVFMSYMQYNIYVAM